MYNNDEKFFKTRKEPSFGKPKLIHLCMSFLCEHIYILFTINYAIVHKAGI